MDRCARTEVWRNQKQWVGGGGRGTLAGCWPPSKPTLPLVSQRVPLWLVTEMSNFENFLPTSHVEEPGMERL